MMPCPTWVLTISASPLTHATVLDGESGSPSHYTRFYECRYSPLRPRPKAPLALAEENAEF